MEYQKAKSAFKSVLPRGPELKQKVLDTAALVATVVGGTLGPGGHPVLIERQEFGLPPTITKDGVTVFRALGFSDATTHCIMEAMRDASVRTAAEAGDGTTTATILAEAFTRLMLQYCETHPGASPQATIREIQALHRDVMVPELERIKLFGDLESDEGRARLKAVATISGNGDVELADAVMRAYDICGDEGNVTLVEQAGPPAVIVEKVDGYPIAMGFEESLQRYYPVFINRQDLQQVHVEKPMFLLYFGRINDIQTLVPVLEKIQQAWQDKYLETPNVVVVAIGFSESVLASLATNWVGPGSINILPLVVPNNSPVHNAQRNFLDDLAAVTGSTIFDQATKPMDDVQFEEIGNIAQDDEDMKWKPLGVTSVEVSRYRTTVMGRCQDDILLARIEEVKAMADQAESELDATLIRERLAKLSGGIARIRISGPSNGEVKERRDRAEDAVCAVRGALRHGCLVAGGWALARLWHALPETLVADEIVRPALLAPLRVLLTNAGIIGNRLEDIVFDICANASVCEPEHAVIFDVYEGQLTEALSRGLLDSAPAVCEALKNSISIATLLGTLGGTIVFPRDSAFEAKESHAAAEFSRTADYNPADERAI